MKQPPLVKRTKCARFSFTSYPAGSGSALSSGTPPASPPAPPTTQTRRRRPGSRPAPAWHRLTQPLGAPAPRPRSGAAGLPARGPRPELAVADGSGRGSVVHVAQRLSCRWRYTQAVKPCYGSDESSRTGWPCMPSPLLGRSVGRYRCQSACALLVFLVSPHSRRRKRSCPGRPQHEAMPSLPWCGARSRAMVRASPRLVLRALPRGWRRARWRSRPGALAPFLPTPTARCCSPSVQSRPLQIVPGKKGSLSSSRPYTSGIYTTVLLPDSPLK